MKNTQIYGIFFSKFRKNFVAAIDVTISNYDVTITSRAFASTMEQYTVVDWGRGKQSICWTGVQTNGKGLKLKKLHRKVGNKTLIAWLLRKQ
jgi:hypothetical protein